VRIDLGAERLLAAERGSEKIAVEIKSFLSESALFDYHGALGQFLNYRLVLEALEPERILYLAVPLTAYELFFQRPLAKALFPVALVNKLVSLSAHSNQRILQKFASQTIS
jgi:XisH protein